MRRSRPALGLGAAVVAGVLTGRLVAPDAIGSAVRTAEASLVAGLSGLPEPAS